MSSLDASSPLPSEKRVRKRIIVNIANALNVAQYGQAYGGREGGFSVPFRPATSFWMGDLSPLPAEKPPAGRDPFLKERETSATR